MLWVALVYGSGIVTGDYAWRPILWWIAAGLVVIVAAAYYRPRRPAVGWTLGLAVFFLIGASHIQARNASGRLDFRIRDFADRQPLQIIAHVTRDGRVLPQSGEIRQTLDVETEQILAEDGSVIPVRGGVRLNVYSTLSRDVSPEESPESNRGISPAPMPAFGFGERISFKARLRRPRNFRNPGGFDYEGYLADHGIAALGSAKIEDVHRLSGFGGSQVALWRSRMHRSIVAKVHELWPLREAALIDAMMIGEEAFLDRDTRVDFQRSGTYHVLVVSGMNVSILAFVLFWAMRRMRIGEIPATCLTILFCIGYAFVTEVGAPVWRATLMCAVYLGTRLLFRDGAMLNAIGTAALALLIFDPRQLLTASFQMTFACVLLVAAIGVPILQRTTQLYKRALTNWESNDFASQLPPKVAQFRVDLQFISSRLSRFIGKDWAHHLVRGFTAFLLSASELIFISAVMQMGLALPMAYYFHRATTVGLPANLIVVPLIQLMMPATVAALGLGYVSPWLARLPALLTTFALNGIAGVVHGLGRLQVAEWRVPVPSFFTIVLSTTAIVLGLWTARRHRALVIVGLAAILASALGLALMMPSPRIHPGLLEVTSIDVGEGDSTLLITPQGRSLLIDAGGPTGPGGYQLDFGEDVVSPYLWTRGISRLDAVAITHAHSDHIGGIIAVLRNFKPKELWVGLEPPNSSISRVIATAEALNVKVVRHWEGDSFPFGGTTVDVLYPPQNALVTDKPRNNDSMVLHVSYGASSVLLEGDAEKQVERRVAEIHHPIANLLKVGHHGSANATTQELVDSAKPQFAIISVGSQNSFGLPRQETLARLAAAGTRVYRTDLDGGVTFYLDGRSVNSSLTGLR